MQQEDGELGIAENEHEEEDEDGGLYSQTLPFYQQPVALQRMQFAHSASATSVSSMSSTTTTPPPPPPPQPSVASVQPLKQQQQHQPTAAQSLTSAALASSATAVNIYQQQHGIQKHPLNPHLDQKIRPEQMTSATAANGNFNINVNASAATAADYKRQEQKLRRLRELHSLALEGGDTARGYCSCDEQWTSSSPPISDSPTLSSNEGHEKTSDGSEANETIQAATTTITTTTTASPTSAETTAAMTGERRMTGNAYKQINVTTGRGRLAVGGNEGGHSRTRQQQKHNNSTIDGVGSIWTGTRANEVAKAAAAVVAAKAAGAAGTAAAMAGAVRGESRPVPAARLKQQHHVRFSDEKNFSD